MLLIVVSSDQHIDTHTMDKQQERVDRFDKIRGRREPTPLGRTTFVVLRLFSGFIVQRCLQIWKPLGMIAAAFNLSNSTSQVDQLRIPVFGSYTVGFQDVIWAMAIAAALKQVIWAVLVGHEPMFVNDALFVAFGHSAADTVNVLLASLASSNPTWRPVYVQVAIFVFAAGILVELTSEVQRKNFKARSENQGKLYTGGLFSLARSVNYFGYLLWRTAFALAGGGIVFGVFTFIMGIRGVTYNQIPSMEDYLSRKYGKQWEAAKNKVPYCLIPYVY